MSGFWGHAVGVITVLLLIAFLAIWVWAWLPRHKQVFDRMARLPLDDDARPPPQPGEAFEPREGDSSNKREEGDSR